MGNSLKAGNIHKAAQDVKVKKHDLKEGDFTYLENQLFLRKKEKMYKDGLALTW
jgi:hypothetical protein